MAILSPPRIGLWDPFQMAWRGWKKWGWSYFSDIHWEPILQETNWCWPDLPNQKHHGVLSCWFLTPTRGGGLWTLLTRVVSKPLRLPVLPSLWVVHMQRSIPRKICDVCIVIRQDFHRICIDCPSTKWPKTMPNIHFRQGPMTGT